MKKYYVDTAIWRDLHENRTDKFRPLGEWAFMMFRKIRENQDIVLYSEIIVEELSKDFDDKIIKNIFSIMSDEGLLRKVEINKNKIQDALKLKNKLEIPFGDAIHAILARDNGAILITRDHDFEKVQDIVEIKKPEDLI